ncbi:pumilio homolog 1 [Lates japonicus]|uniref:Pumilio homolog 1 n=1 Tax=Lates japonicus TaxID=270547 RepID=A0AAD3N4N9_LATJO|nr:pumilio homolog 1 [Lates japonicus]
MNRTLSLIPSRHAALLPAPPSSRHVVGVKAWGVREKLGPKSATIHPLRRLWWNEQCVCVEEESSALAGFIQPPP